MSIPQDANGQAQGAIGLGLNKLVVRGRKPRAAWDFLEWTAAEVEERRHPTPPPTDAA
ncbi:hypothetical protein [Phyllobacterium zundukense]|uniref:hypothetical protein n=1 Tax=Phyllobacterium zundukense TaxID=1867719 RepID=UPI001F1B3DDC|nr:hypothetical protein [Phyllobacterium zundukense]